MKEVDAVARQERLVASFRTRALKCSLVLVLPVMVCMPGLQGCASTSGVHVTVPGQQPVQIAAGSRQWPKGDMEFIVSAQDALQVEVLPGAPAASTQLMDYGSRLQIEIAFHAKNYAIVPGDTLELAIDTESGKSAEMMVRPDGYVTVPRLGQDIFAAGLSPQQLSQNIAKRFAGRVIGPVVTVAVIKTRLDELSRVSGLYVVDREGSVVIPLLGRFKALGQTSAQIEQAIKVAARKYFYNEMQVAVSPVQATGRDVDPRLDPDGRQYFKGAVRVAPNGTIVLPEVGTVQAAGRSLADLRIVLARAMQRLYRNPVNVSVTLLESGSLSVFVGGEVHAPGRYPYAKSMTMLQAVTSAGWVNEWGNLDKAVLLHRAGSGQYVVYQVNLAEVVDGKAPEQDLMLSPRDIVLVPRSGVAKADLFVDQYIRRMLPFTTSVNYGYTQGVFASHP